jgi:hypothetical protein
VTLWRTTKLDARTDEEWIAADEAAAANDLEETMTLVRAFLTVAASSAVCTLVGVGLGALMGLIAPDFYQMSFRDGLWPGIDPVQIGIGFGLNAVVFSGVVIGLVVVAIVTYYELRSQEARQPDTQAESNLWPLSESARRSRGPSEGGIT